MIGGVLIPKNAQVSLAFGSANHDEALYGKTSEQFNIERVAQSSQNLIFGAGEHRCIGEPMAMQTVPIVMDAWLDKYPKLSVVAVGTQKLSDPYFRGFEHLLLDCS
jgi:cytochrome P450